MAVDQAVEERAATAPWHELTAALDGRDLAAIPNAAAVAHLKDTTRMLAHAHAVHLAALAEVAHCAPLEENDPADLVKRTLAPSSWAGAEVAAALTSTPSQTARDVRLALALRNRLPMVLAALSAGTIDVRKAHVFAEHLEHLDAVDRNDICTRLMDQAEGWTTGQLAYRLLREVLAVDPDFARRRRDRGIRERGVTGYLSPNGTATISARGLPATRGAVALERLDVLADVIQSAGHPGALAQIRADLWLGHIDGTFTGLDRPQIIMAMLAAAGVAHSTPDTHGSEPRQGVEVWAGLGTLLGHNDAAAELPGWGPIFAQEARELVKRQIGGAEWRFAVVDERGELHTGVTSRRPAPATAESTCVGGIVEIRSTEPQLAELAARDDLPDDWALVVHDIHTQFEKRDKSTLDDQPDARFPGAALRRDGQMRDHTCVGPGCQRAATKCDQDHTVGKAEGGETVSANLGPLCDLHHAMKSKGGWTLTQPRPGEFRWVSPLRQIYWTRGSPIDLDAI